MLTKRDLTTTERMQCGAMSGVVAQSVTYPIEVVRRRMQTIGMVGNDTAFNNIPGVKTASGDAIPPSFLQTIRNVHAEQGIRGFYKGVSMNWIKGPVAFSISFTAFDTVQGLMESDSERASRIPH
jgi:solute carrier family 25, member 42